MSSIIPHDEYGLSADDYLKLADDDMSANAKIAYVLNRMKWASRKPVRQLVEETGIPTATLNRALSGERDMRMTQFMLLSYAVGSSPAEVIDLAWGMP